ncbi:MAG: HAD family phosphatase [Gemmataceae bacterium]|nr:HAD family phosphatase [Gemmataceae bacterium]
MKPATLVFDFGNVIGYFSHRKAAEQLSRFTTTPVETLVQTLFHCQTEIELESGRFTPEQFRDFMRKELNLRCSDKEFDTGFSDMFTPNLEVCSLIPALAARHRLLLLSNTNWFHAGQFIRQFATVLKHFDRLFLSHEMGVRKPAQAIYRMLNENAGVAPAECLFIDDMEANIEAARENGWRGILYQSSAALVQQLNQAGILITPESTQSGEQV